MGGVGWFRFLGGLGMFCVFMCFLKVFYIIAFLIKVFGCVCFSSC